MGNFIIFLLFDLYQSHIMSWYYTGSCRNYVSNCCNCLLVCFLDELLFFYSDWKWSLSTHLCFNFLIRFHVSSLGLFSFSILSCFAFSNFRCDFFAVLQIHPIVQFFLLCFGFFLSVSQERMSRLRFLRVIFAEFRSDFLNEFRRDHQERGCFLLCLKDLTESHNVFLVSVCELV